MQTRMSISQTENQSGSVARPVGVDPKKKYLYRQYYLITSKHLK
jgi:hypothetical protein